MKRILYIVPNKFWGGGQQYIYELSQTLLEEGKGKPYYVGRNAEVLRKRFTLLGLYKSLPLKTFFDPFSIVSLAFFIRKHRIEVVHAHMPKDAIMAVIAKKLFGLKNKIVMTRHLVRPGKFNAIYRWAYANIDYYIFVSAVAQEGFFASCNRKIKINNTVIYNSVKGKRTDNNELNLRAGLGLAQETFLIGFAGRIVQDKGVEVLLKAFAALPPPDHVALVLAGDVKEDYLQVLKEIIKENGIEDKVYFQPYVENIYSFARQIDIAVMPSIVREACPLIILEYMTEGKPIVSTDNGAQTELLTRDTEAVFVPPASPEDLTAAMQLLIDDPVKRNELSRRVKIKSQQFDYSTFIDNMSKVYGC